MPSRPRHGCNWPLCKELTTKRYCVTHTRTAEHRRGSAASRGYGHMHRQWRKIILSRDPLCVHCKKEGRTEPAVVADHIVPIGQGGARFKSSNGQGLCVSCHNRKTKLEQPA